MILLIETFTTNHQNKEPKRTIIHYLFYTLPFPHIHYTLPFPNIAKKFWKEMENDNDQF